MNRSIRNQRQANRRAWSLSTFQLVISAIVLFLGQSAIKMVRGIKKMRTIMMGCTGRLLRQLFGSNTPDSNMNIRPRRSMPLLLALILPVAFLSNLAHAESVTWTDLVGVDVLANNTLKKKTSWYAGYNAGAASQQSFAGDGAMEFTATAINYQMTVGLSYSNPDNSFYTTDYGICLCGSTFRVYENGWSQGDFGSFQAGDVMRIERYGSTVNYLKNGVLLYTSTVASSGSLLVDASLSKPGAAAANGQIIDYSAVQDTTPPVISAVTASNIGLNTATITWSTNEPSTSQVTYGTNTSSDQSTAVDTSLVTSHSVTLTGLSADTIYLYQVVSADAAANSANSVDNNFTTNAPDSTPPVISAVTAGNITTSTALISWTTDEPSSSQVSYGISTSGEQSTVVDPTLVTSHSVQLSGLTPNTTYLYQVISADALNNTANSSDATFTDDNPEQVVWSPISAAIVSGDSLISTCTTTNGFCSGGISTQTFVDTGAVEFPTSTFINNTNLILGLSDQYALSTSGWDSINYAIRAGDSYNPWDFQVYEWGTYKGTFGTFADGDVLRIERNGTTVRYMVNGVVRYTSNTQTSQRLKAHVRLHHDGQEVTATIINASNAPPKAVYDVGGVPCTCTPEFWDHDGSGGEPVYFNSLSTDSDGTIVGYEWKDGGTVIGNTSSITPDLAVGTHTITLTVTDDLGATDSVNGTVIIHPNPPPVANAGADQVVADADGTGSETVTVDGSASTDYSIVGYLWQEGATTLGTSVSISPTLAVGSHTLTLTVTDNGGATDTDTVVVTVLANTAPTADAGADQSVSDADGTGSEMVTVDGSGSADSDGTIASYLWEEGATTLGTSASISPVLAVGAHTLTLTVTDNGGATATDTMVVTVAANAPPTANAGADQTVPDADASGSEIVTVDGSGSTDSDGAIVSYLWEEGATTLGTTAGISPTLAVGAHTLTLTVTDNGGATDTDTVVVTVTANAPPTANAGADQTVEDANGSGSETVTVDGSGSTDSDGTIVSYLWQEGGTTLGTTASISPDLLVGAHTLTLTVTDDLGATGTDTVVVTVDPASGPVGQAVIWTDLVGVDVLADNSLRKKTNWATGYNAGAASQQSFAGDGAMEFTATAINYQLTVGLSNSNPDNSFYTTDYGICLCGSTFRVYENGWSQGDFGSFQAGDVMRIQRYGNTVSYLKNGVLLYTSTVASSGSLLVDASLSKPGAKITNVQITDMSTP